MKETNGRNGEAKDTAPPPKKVLKFSFIYLILHLAKVAEIKILYHLPFNVKSPLNLPFFKLSLCRVTVELSLESLKFVLRIRDLTKKKKTVSPENFIVLFFT